MPRARSATMAAAACEIPRERRGQRPAPRARFKWKPFVRGLGISHSVEDTEDVEVTIQTQMKIDPQVGDIQMPRDTEPQSLVVVAVSIPDHSQKPLRILQKVGRREGQGAGGPRKSCLPRPPRKKPQKVSKCCACEAHAPRVEPRTEDCLTRAGSGSCFGFDLLVWQASNKGVSKGEGKQGKGSGKSVPEKRFAITLNIERSHASAGQV